MNTYIYIYRHHLVIHSTHKNGDDDDFTTDPPGGMRQSGRNTS